MRLVPDELLHAILFREAIDQALMVFKGSSADVIRHTDVESTVPAACHDVDVIVLRHGAVLPGWPAFAGHDTMAITATPR